MCLVDLMYVVPIMQKKYLRTKTVETQSFYMRFTWVYFRISINCNYKRSDVYERNFKQKKSDGYC